jgi:hypothetical protein
VKFARVEIDRQHDVQQIRLDAAKARRDPREVCDNSAAFAASRIPRGIGQVAHQSFLYGGCLESYISVWQPPRRHQRSRELPGKQRREQALEGQSSCSPSIVSIVGTSLERRVGEHQRRGGA